MQCTSDGVTVYRKASRQLLHRDKRFSPRFCVAAFGNTVEIVHRRLLSKLSGSCDRLITSELLFNIDDSA